MHRLFNIVFISCILYSVTAKSQPHTEDWVNYFSSAGGYPVSINVDLGLQAKAPLKERPYLIIFRTSFPVHQKTGFPDFEQTSTLDSIENALVEALTLSNGSIFAGRFTQRGLREFYFYCLDTTQYSATLFKTMSSFQQYPWLAKAMFDKTWSNYFDVLFPNPDDLDKIENRLTIIELQKKGDKLFEPREITHTLYFSSSNNRLNFLKELSIPGCIITEQPDNPEGTNAFPYKLVLTMKEKPSLEKIQPITTEMRKLAQKNSGKYQGWKTFVVK
jgi:uncharacterized protein (TIGR01619 family)